MGLLSCELEHEVIAFELLNVVLDLLVETPRLVPVNGCQVSVQHDLLTPDDIGVFADEILVYERGLRPNGI